MTEADDHHAVKKVKFDHVPSTASTTVTECKLRMNPHIHLCLHVPDRPQHYHAVPEFTHQLFEQEEMTFSHLASTAGTAAQTSTEAVAAVKALQVEVHVNTCTLEHDVHVLHLYEESKNKTVLEDCLRKGLPEETLIHFGHHHHACPDKPHSAVFEARPVLGQMRRQFTSDNNHYLITHCDSSSREAAKTLQCFEKLAMWYIETADSVDFYQNPQWEVLFLYQQHHNSADPPTPIHSFVGYVTLFTFHTPLCGSRLRLCQILILPHQQSHGLGREMLLEVYRLAQERPEIIEVTVEDPCVGFQRLRDIVDVEWALLHGSSHNTSTDEVQKRLEALSKVEDEEKLGNQVKIIKAQAMFVKESCQYLSMLYSLLEDSQSRHNDDVGKEEDDLESLPTNVKLQHLHKAIQHHSQFPDFRLKAKRNLLKLNKDLKYLDKPSMQKELSKLFEENLVRYHHVLRAMNRLDILPPSLLRSEVLRIGQHNSSNSK